MTLDGQNILVTGATGAIGQAICRALAAEGARVVIHYGRHRDIAEALLADLDGRGWCLASDLSHPEGAASLWASALDAAGGPAGLVNNAGIRTEVPVDAPLAGWQAAWEREMRVNFYSAVDLCRGCLIPRFDGAILSQDGRKHHRTDSSWARHDHARCPSSNTAIASFARATGQGTRDQCQDGCEVAGAGVCRGSEPGGTGRSGGRPDARPYAAALRPRRSLAARSAPVDLRRCSRSGRGRVADGEAQARMVFADPPYNVKIDSHVGGADKVKHREFAVAARG